MSDFSNYAENKVCDHALGIASWTMPTPYVALFTAVTDAEAGTGTEVTGGGYVRMALSGAAMSSASGGASSNGTALSWAAASGNWSSLSPVTHAGLFDASTAGNAITVIKALPQSKIIGTGDVFTFPIGDIDFAVQ
jgi:hypothetical protein